MKRTLFTVLCVFLTAALFGASVELEMYTTLYDRTTTTVERLGILQDVSNEGISDAVEFYALALDRLVGDYANLKSNQEVNAADSIVFLVAPRLGEAKHLAAAPSLWRAEQAFSNPVVKAEILATLGQMGAVEFLSPVIQILQNLNDQPTPDRQAGEQIAYGAITALEYYGDPAGYVPVYLASLGWYSERIKSYAAAALPNILADPVEPLTDIIRSPAYSYAIKYTALQTIENSNVSNDDKASVAVAAYSEAWRVYTSDTGRRMQLANTRKMAINMIRRYGTEDTAVYRLLERSYKEGIDEDEKLNALATLSALSSDEAVWLLSSFLTTLNTKVQDGSLTQTDERMVRAVIPALGNTGHTDAASPLRVVTAVNWTDAVKRLATDALQTIQSSGK
jgi:hypothetical protein